MGCENQERRIAGLAQLVMSLTDPEFIRLFEYAPVCNNSGDLKGSMELWQQALDLARVSGDKDHEINRSRAFEGTISFASRIESVVSKPGASRA